MNSHRILQFFVLGGALLLAACAQSPQTIQVAPVFPEADKQVGQNQPVHVRVSDQRDNKVLGSRGGVYRETATFSLANDLSLAVQPELEKYMAAMGFDVGSLSANTTDLHVIFESLVYDHPKDSGIGHDMKMSAGVKVEASKQDGSRYDGRYRVNKQQKFFNAPSSSQNKDLVNELVVEVIQNMLADPKLMRFIQQ